MISAGFGRLPGRWKRKLRDGWRQISFCAAGWTAAGSFWMPAWKPVSYTHLSEQFEISYQQVRNYTIKYEKQGVEALRDRRGKRKPEAEMSELEKLRAENRILRAEKEHAQMEADFLKKLAEIERRRG